MSSPQTVHDWFREYGASHRHPTNKTIHWLCVPPIYWSVFALLWAIPNPGWLGAVGLNTALLVMAMGQAWYFRMSPRLGFGMLVFNLLILTLTVLAEMALGNLLWVVALAVFVLAWIGQFIGHQIEGQKPSFFKDVFFLLVGPAWLMGFIYRRMGWQY